MFKVNHKDTIFNFEQVSGDWERDKQIQTLKSLLVTSNE